MNITGTLVTLLALIMLAGCSSNEAKPEAPQAAVEETQPVAEVPEIKTAEPTVTKVVTFEGGKIDDAVVIQVMDRMDNQGCLYDKVSLTTHKQWGQFVLKCSPPTAVPSTD